ncbi:MAG TPA: DUF502 domain-containing protein [Phycisphaerae bacterium]|nr:DUF502 domain-containing protein [Phycisphaerae bacterium]HRY67647.1 DUF502 domain-containing protein [Phycisphaerae bacterium]HSA25034.1 DUF502 domain-containing protein [Phycisphaerae bacterium]
MPYAQPRRLWPAVHALLRTRIVAGVLTVIPIWVTWVVVKFVFDTMKSATEPIAQRVAKHMIEANHELVPEKVREHVDWIVPLLAVLLTLFLLYLLGLFTANVFGRRIIKAVEGVFERLPLIKTVYKSIKQIVVAIGGFQSMEFQRVVLFDFPAPGYKRVAFLTSVMTDQNTGRRVASLLVPYTPYVTAGYMQIVPLEQVSETNWTVEEAVKWIMSGGIIHPDSLPFDQLHPVRWDESSGERAKPPPAKAGKTAR